MALTGTDIFVVRKAGAASAIQVKADDLFSGAYDDYHAIVNEGNKSHKCKVVDLLDLSYTGTNGATRILLVNRGTKSYKVTLQELAENYGLPPEPGQKEFISSHPLNGSPFFWTVPKGVRSICICAVGGGGGGGAAFWAGGGGGGGGLAYRNNIPVSPNEPLTIQVGRGGEGVTANNGGIGKDGGRSSVVRPGVEYLIWVDGGQGGRGTSDGDYGADTSGAAGPWPGGTGGGVNSNSHPNQITYKGGNGGTSKLDYSGGGGAPGSYTQTGRQGQSGDTSSSAGCIPTSGSGGGAGGARGDNRTAQGGGGIGIKGRGTTATSLGRGGSGGSNGTTNGGENLNLNGGQFGGGGGGEGWDGKGQLSGNGGKGAVRIIWGENRSYPYNAADA